MKINSFSILNLIKRNSLTKNLITLKNSKYSQDIKQNKTIFKNFDKSKGEIEKNQSSKEKPKKNLPQSTQKQISSQVENKKNHNQKIINRKAEKINAKMTDDHLMKNLKSDFEAKPSLKENYASLYYRHKLENEFDLFNLRNILYSYVFVKQRTGKIYLNICDSYYTASNEEKNQKVQDLLKLFDWLDIKLDFDEKLQKKIFESQRVEDYQKFLRFLINQRDAYICFCKNYMKCEKNCFHSNENLYTTKDIHSNPEVMYVRFKNQNAEYKLYDYMEREDVVFDSTQYDDFLLYKNFNKQYTECFKRVIDDDVFNVTHIMEDKKSFNPFKNAILTKHLLFGEKKYIELPNVKVKYWNKDIFEKLDLNYLKSRYITPEAMLNEAYMLGHGKGPLKEYKELLANNKDKDLVDWSRILLDFDLNNVTQIGATFDIRRLLYFNKRLLIKKFIKSHESFKPKIFEDFKENFLKVFPKHVNKMKNWDYEQWRKIIYLIIPEVMTYEDLYTYYFLFEKPIVSAITKENRKIIKTYFLDEEYKQHILKDIQLLFNKIKTFDAVSVNREISYYIFKKYQQDRHLMNVNFFQLVKFVITGYSDCPNVGEICEVIGKREVLNRVKKAFSLNKTSMVENVRLLEEKKNNCLKMLSGIKVDEKLLEDEARDEEEDLIEHDNNKLIGV